MCIRRLTNININVIDTKGSMNYDYTRDTGDNAYQDVNTDHH